MIYQVWVFDELSNVIQDMRHHDLAKIHEALDVIMASPYDCIISKEDEREIGERYTWKRRRAKTNDYTSCPTVTTKGATQ